MMDREIENGMGYPFTPWNATFSMLNAVGDMLPRNFAGVSDTEIFLAGCGFSYPHSIKDEYLKFQLKDAVADAQCLNEVAEKLAAVLKKMSDEMYLETIGFVIGAVSETAAHKIAENHARLVRFTKVIGRELENGLVFSSADIYDDALRATVASAEIPTDEWLVYWKNILIAGLITDIYVIPGWQKSERAIAEYKMALAYGLRVHTLGFEA